MSGPKTQLHRNTNGRPGLKLLRPDPRRRRIWSGSSSFKRPTTDSRLLLRGGLHQDLGIVVRALLGLDRKPESWTAGADERGVAADVLSLQRVDLADRVHRHVAGLADRRTLRQVDVHDENVVQVLREERRAQRRTDEDPGDEDSQSNGGCDGSDERCTSRQMPCTGAGIP